MQVGTIADRVGGAVGNADRTDVGFDVSAAFDAHGAEILGFAVNALRDKPLAEDCVQETFLRAWRARARYDARRASLRTWLFAIARNVIADTLSARARLPRLGDDAVPEHAHHPDPLQRLRVVEGLAKLSEPHRDVLVAVHMYGMTYQELADQTGVAVATLRSRAFYALRTLRDHLEGSEDTHDA